jgi:hypothetical protein
MPLNPKNELLLAHLRGDEDFEEQLVEYHSKTKAKKPKAVPSRSRRRARWQGRAATASASERGARTATASASDRGARTAIASAKVAIECSSRQRGAKAGEPATSRTSARPDVKAENRAGCRELLLRDDATAKTTMQLSPRRPAFRGVHLFVTVSIGRKVWLFAKQSN